MKGDFTDEQYDALREICNLATGQASRALATLLDRFVQLSVPEIAVLAADQVLGQLLLLGKADEGLAIVRQSFYGGLYGEVLALHTRATVDDVVDLLGHRGDAFAASEQELLLDISNLLSGAVLNGIGQQLAIELGYTAPTLINDRLQLEQLRVDGDKAWTHVLFTQVQFRLEKRQFSSRLLIFFPDGCFTTIRSAVSRFLEAL